MKRVSIPSLHRVFEVKDVLHGGKADKRDPNDFDQDELKKGIEHEREHTDDEDITQEIAMDHLAEDPKYYSHIDAMEKRVKKHG